MGNNNAPSDAASASWYFRKRLMVEIGLETTEMPILVDEGSVSRRRGR